MPKGKLPPCPDPELYILVETKEGSFWRRKRGTVKKASLNKTFSDNNQAFKTLMPAAARLVKKLDPYTRQLDMGRITARIAGKWLKPYIETGSISFAALNKMELQRDHPLEHLCNANYIITANEGFHRIYIDLVSGQVIAQNTLVTDYYFEAVLLYGDPTMDGGLVTEDRTSELYHFGAETTAGCALDIPCAPAGAPWLLFLKVSCLEENEMAAHYKNYAMKVVGVGMGESKS